MKTHKLTIVGGLMGAVIIVCSIGRWFFMFYDPSQMILGSSIGIIVCIFSYIYNWMKCQDEYNININKRLDAFTEWWTKQELK